STRPLEDLRHGTSGPSARKDISPQRRAGVSAIQQRSRITKGGSMKQLFGRTQLSAVSWKLILIVAGAMSLCTGCARKEKKPEARSEPSKIKVDVNDDGPMIITTGTAEFQVLPFGYVQAFLSAKGTKISLDEPGESTHASERLVQDGKKVRCKLDFS